MRTLRPNPSWSETKEALINNFGVKESYHQLYLEAFGAPNTGIVNYYSHLRSILFKINEKYEYDSERLIEFSPLNSEKIILRKFLNNIDVNLAFVVINRNITQLRDAYNLLEQQCLIRHKDQKTFLSNPNARPNFNSNRNQWGQDISQASGTNGNYNNRDMGQLSNQGRIQRDSTNRQNF